MHLTASRNAHIESDATDKDATHQQIDPQVWNGHPQPASVPPLVTAAPLLDTEALPNHAREPRRWRGAPVVEAHAALPHWPTERRHATHILCNGDGLGVQVVHQLVGQHEIHTCVHVGLL